MPFRFRYTLTIFLLITFCYPLKAQVKYTLHKALQTARNYSPILRNEALNAGIIQADIITAKLRPDPVLSSETLQLLQPSQFPAHTDWYNGQNRQTLWQLTKRFQVAGQRRYKIDVAGQYMALTEKNYSETERNLLSEVAVKWLEGWMSQKQLDIILVAKNNIDSLVLTNQIRHQNQVITQTDLFRTELLAKQYAMQYKTAQQQITNHQKELKFLLGVEDDVLIDTTADLPALQGSIDSLFRRSLRLRGDIQAAQASVNVSESNIKLQKSLSFPQPELGLIWNPQNSIQYLGIYANINLPLFNRNQGEIKKSYLLKEQAEQQLSILQTQVQSEITIALANYQLQQQQLENFSSVLQQSQTILDNVKYTYLKGGTTIIDFLEAQRSWLETKQQYYDAMYTYSKSYIQLLFSTGLINQSAL